MGFSCASSVRLLSAHDNSLAQVWGGCEAPKCVDKTPRGVEHTRLMNCSEAGCRVEVLITRTRTSTLVFRVRPQSPFSGGIEYADLSVLPSARHLVHDLI